VIGANIGEGSGSSNLVSFFILKFMGLFGYFSDVLLLLMDSSLLLWVVFGVQQIS